MVRAYGRGEMGKEKYRSTNEKFQADLLRLIHKFGFVIDPKSTTLDNFSLQRLKAVFLFYPRRSLFW